MAKGGDYERTICKRLSLWLTHGEDDDQLWRSSQSGGRATARAKKGKGTKGHAGDTVATGPEGVKLLRLVTLEIKRGYNARANVHSLLDLRPRNDAVQVYEEWVWQSDLAAARAGTPYWWLIHRRDGRNATIFMPYRLWNMLTGDTKLDRPSPFLQMSFAARRDFKPAVGRNPMKRGKLKFLCVVGMQLEHFLEVVEPETLWQFLPKKGKK